MFGSDAATGEVKVWRLDALTSACCVLRSKRLVCGALMPTVPVSGPNIFMRVFGEMATFYH
jgi:hypothetical protein